jgi:hypothetical protein
MAVNLFQTGGSGNWNNTASWSLGTVPTASDGHVATFDATSPDCTLGAARSCNNIDFTGYTNTLTMSTNQLLVNGNITLYTGLIISGTGRLVVSSCTFTSNGYVWPNDLQSNLAATITLVGNLEILGTYISGTQNSIINKTTNETFTCYGITTASSRTISGTADIYLLGGTWDGANGNVNNNLFIDGNVTISNGSYGNGTLTHLNTSGFVTIIGTFNIVGSTGTYDCSTILFINVTSNVTTKTITFNSDFICSGQLTLNGQVTFTGPNGFTCDSLVVPSVSSLTFTLQHSVTYTITSAFNCFSSRVGSIVLFTSSHASNKAILTLQNPAACNVLANFTRIDASNGRTIPTFNGTITDCLNILEFHDLPTSSHAL